MRQGTRAALLVIITVLLVLAGVAAVRVFGINQFMNRPRAVFLTSPTQSEYQVWLVITGLVDPEIVLCVRSSRQNDGKARRVAVVQQDPCRYFRHLQWSRDGALVVATIANEDCVKAGFLDIRAIAFDFSTGAALPPKWDRYEVCAPKSIEQWKQQDHTVEALVIAHGGFSDQPAFSKDDFVDRARGIWFWSIPQE